MKDYEEVVSNCCSDPLVPETETEMDGTITGICSACYEGCEGV